MTPTQIVKIREQIENSQKLVEATFQTQRKLEARLDKSLYSSKRATFVGRHFRMNEDHVRGSWRWIKVIGVNGDRLTTIETYKDSRRKSIRIEQDDIPCREGLIDGAYKSVSKEKYEKAIAKIMRAALCMVTIGKSKI